MAGTYAPKLGPSVGAALPGLPKGGVPVRGEVTFAIPGTVNWTVPAGVSTISAVVVGGGGGAVYNGLPNEDVSSGAGGGLSWVNRISVSPGETITILIGAGGRGASNENSTFGGTGGGSTVTVKGNTVCSAVGGGRGTIGSAATGGANSAGDGGGSGGDGAFGGTLGERYATGGAAGGYSGDGGDGVAGNSGTAGNAGSGGAGGSGGLSSIGNNAAGSGGVGLNGEGISGAGGNDSAPASPGLGGSGGENGGTSTGLSINNNTAGTAGAFGAGGSVAFTDSNPAPSYALQGAHGAVRIIFGTGRAFPSTDTAQ